MSAGRWAWRAALGPFLLSMWMGSGCATSTPQRGLPANATVEDADSTLNAGDTFEVAVYGESDLSGKFRVGEDGKINFPLVGTLTVQGKGASEIASTIRAALLEHGILRSPNVSVFVVERRPRQVSVMGAVVRPGTYPLTAGMSLVQALGAAGGLTPLARGGAAVLTRVNDGGARQRFKIDIDSITEGQAADVPLQAGDLVYVPERVF